ncbi:MAG: glucokinase [Aestuariivirga sp.]
MVERAKAGTDPLARKSAELFVEWLGRFAGNAALMFGARGGVYIAGGIAPRILDALIAGRFRLGFESKGRMADYMKSVPAYVILIDDAGLKGAATILTAPNRSLEGRPGLAGGRD